MKARFCFTLVWFAFLISAASPVKSQDEYSLVPGERGQLVCLGRWVPSRDLSTPGICEGQLLTPSQLGAISARQSVDRLDQLVVSLESIDKRLAANNDLLSRLLDAAVNTQTSLDRQAIEVKELVSDLISQRLDMLPQEVVDSEAFSEELAKMKEDILKEVSRRYPIRPTTPKK